MRRILIIGATGTVGREVVGQLLIENANVRALVRNPDSANLPAHVETVRGDLTLPASLDTALQHVDAVFLVWRAPVAAAEAAIERIGKHAGRVVFLSAPYRAPHPFFQQPNPSASLHAELERLIEASGLEWTFLQPGMFAANALRWWMPAIRESDTIRWPCAEVPTAPIHERDIAAVAVRALCEEGHARKAYVLTGPESLSQRRQIGIIGDAIGRPLRFEEMAPDEARRVLSAQMSPAVADMLLNAWSEAIGRPAYITSTVTDITGAAARTFREWVIDHAAAFRP
jgi:uncharacterized protein YbjT (DUF2867 family)